MCDLLTNQIIMNLTLDTDVNCDHSDLELSFSHTEGLDIIAVSMMYWCSTKRGMVCDYDHDNPQISLTQAKVLRDYLNSIINLHK